MKRVVAVSVLLCAIGVQAATWESSTVWGFANLGNSSTNAVSVQGWYFSATQATSSQWINGITFTGLNIGPEASGSNGILSWSGVSGYDLSTFTWGLEAARDAVSVGGIHGDTDAAMSLSFEMAAGLDYVVEVVALQGSNFTTSRYFDLAVDGVALIDNYYVPNTNTYNNHVIIRGTSDGIINLDFSAGSVADANPAISMITVAQVIPEPASALLISSVTLIGLFIRRRFVA
jgi:hypothetical protein